MKRIGARRSHPFLRLLVRILLSLAACSVLLVLLFKWVPVRYTPLMLKRSIEYRADTSYHSRHEWVPLNGFSPELRKAAIQMEDRHFFLHHGLELAGIREEWAIHRSTGKPLDGHSTISQQTAKNVFTFASRTYLRKGVELWWTLLLEVIWGKQRILEVYLNVAETGKGLYGFEAAARTYYGIPANELNLEQALSLVLCLPNPRKYSPLDALTPERQEKYVRALRHIPEKEYPAWIEAR